MEPLVTVNTTELARFKVVADRFDKAIIRGVRKRIRNIGQGAIGEVKKTLRLPPPTSGDSSTGAREALEAGTRVAISFSKRSAGAKITTSGSAHNGFAAPYNRKSFRHPVHGNRNAWVNQEGRPYFGAVILPYLDTPEVKREIVAVLDDAVKAIGGRGK